MALNPHFSDTAANAAANALTALLNSGKLRIYDGSQPANANTAVSTQNLLAELTFNATAFGGASAGVATANAITSATAAATGTAAWFRAVKSDGTTVVWDGSVGTSGANLNLGTVAISSGATVSVSALTYTFTE
jgi:hypothetical protein